MKEHLGWSQTEKRLVLSAFFVADMSCMFIAGLRQRVSVANAPTCCRPFSVIGTFEMRGT